MTSSTDIYSSLDGGAGTPFTSVATNLGLGSSAPVLPVMDPAAQVAATPGATPEIAAPYGDPGDWGRWGAVAAGTTYLASKANTAATPEVVDSVRQRYANEVRMQDSYPRTREAFRAARNARGAANPSAVGRLRDATAGARSVISRTGRGLVDKAAARVPTGRTVVNLARGAARAIGPRVGPRAAALAARIGLRMAAFAIPGPGWVVGAAVFVGMWLFDDSMRRFVNNLTGKLFGVNNSPAFDAPPEPPRTLFLPLTHDGDRDSVIDIKDREMVDLNAAAFAFDPNKVWHPTAPEIETTPTFELSTLAFDDLARLVFDRREALEATLRTYRGEPVVDKVAGFLKSSMESLDAFGSTVLPAVTDLVSTHAVQTNNLYLKLRDANNASRQEISNSGAGLLPWTSDVDESKMGQLADAYTTYATEQDQLNGALAKTFSEWIPPASSNGGRLSAPDQSAIPGPSAPGSALSTPAGGGSALPNSSVDSVRPNAGSGVDKSGPSKGEVLDALRGLGAGTSPGLNPLSGSTPSNPLGAGMQSPFGAGMQPFGAGMQSPFGAGMQNPLNQLGQGAGLNTAVPQPANTAGKADTAKLESKLRDLLKTSSAKDTVADKRAKDEKNEGAEATEGSTGEGSTGKAPGVTEPAETRGGAPTEPRSEGTADMIATALGVEPPANDAQPDPTMSRTAEVAGRVIEFEDPKSARMAEIMQAKDGTAPPTVQDAATRAGFTLPPAGEPIGTVVATADLRPGDLIMGDNDRNGLYLGDGKVLSGGEVRPVADVANFTGDGHGIFRLEDTAPSTSPTGDVPGTAGAAPAAEASTEVPPATGTSAPAPEGPVAAATPDHGTGTAAPPIVDGPEGETTVDAPSESPADSMPLPRSSIPTSDTANGAPTTPTVPVGD